MAPKHWTILIVPPGIENTRTVVVTPRARRALIYTACTLGLMVASAVGILFTPFATPGGRLAAAENARLRARLTQIDERLVALNDTLVAIGVRDQQLRVMAGMTEPLKAGVDLTAVADVEGLIRRATELAASFRTVSDTLTKNFERLASTPSIMPTTGWLSSHFSASRFHPVLHENRAHEGIDLSAPMGAPIVAPAGGLVKSVTFEPGYGNTFEIDHGNGIVTKFAHCSRIVVRAGQTVTRGQLIATVGNTGLSTGPHLHYEVHVNGKPVDPLSYVLPGKVAD